MVFPALSAQSSLDFLWPTRPPSDPPPPHSPPQPQPTPTHTNPTIPHTLTSILSLCSSRFFQPTPPSASRICTAPRTTPPSRAAGSLPSRERSPSRFVLASEGGGLKLSAAGPTLDLARARVGGRELGREGAWQRERWRRAGRPRPCCAHRVSRRLQCLSSQPKRPTRQGAATCWGLKGGRGQGRAQREGTGRHRPPKEDRAFASARPGTPRSGAAEIRGRRPARRGKKGKLRSTGTSKPNSRALARHFSFFPPPHSTTQPPLHHHHDHPRQPDRLDQEGGSCAPLPGPPFSEARLICTPSHLAGWKGCP